MLLCCAGAASADVEGRLIGDRVFPAVVYAPDLPAQTAAPDTRARLRQVHLKFSPMVLPVLRGTTVEFTNDDENAHNVFSPTASDEFDLGTFGRATRLHLFRDPGVHVVLCNVHVEMVAWVLVLKNPAFASSDKDGLFRIKLPPGRHRLVLYRPRVVEVERTVDVPESGNLKLEWPAQ